MESGTNDWVKSLPLSLAFFRLLFIISLGGFNLKALYKLRQIGHTYDDRYQWLRRSTSTGVLLIINMLYLLFVWMPFTITAIQHSLLNTPYFNNYRDSSQTTHLHHNIIDNPVTSLHKQTSDVRRVTTIRNSSINEFMDSSVNKSVFHSDGQIDTLPMSDHIDTILKASPNIRVPIESKNKSQIITKHKNHRRRRSSEAIVESEGSKGTWTLAFSPKTDTTFSIKRVDLPPENNKVVVEQTDSFAKPRYIFTNLCIILILFSEVFKLSIGTMNDCFTNLKVKNVSRLNYVYSVLYVVLPLAIMSVLCFYGDTYTFQMKQHHLSWTNLVLYGLINSLHINADLLVAIFWESVATFLMMLVNFGLIYWVVIKLPQTNGSSRTTHRESKGNQQKYELCSMEDFIVNIIAKFVVVWWYYIRPIVVASIFFCNGEGWSDIPCWISQTIMVVSVVFVPIAFFVTNSGNNKHSIDYCYNHRPISTISSKVLTGSPNNNRYLLTNKSIDSGNGYYWKEKFNSFNRITEKVKYFIGKTAKRSSPSINKSIHSIDINKKEEVYRNLKFYLGRDIFYDESSEPTNFRNFGFNSKVFGQNKFDKPSFSEA